MLHDVLAAAKREHYRVNLIEAFDQPWKRYLEGTVGGHWGLFDAESREPKFGWGQAVSNHPYWQWQAGAGLVLITLTFGAAIAARQRRLNPREPTLALWLGVAGIALVAGALIGWTGEKAIIESLGLVGWVRSLTLVAAAIAAPLLAAAALASGVAVPGFATILARAGDRPRDALALALGGVAIVTAVVALEGALGLVFDPRYRDFPFTALTGAAVPFLVLSVAPPRHNARRGVAETVMAAALAASAVYVVVNESLANWQALWFAAALAALAVSLLRLPAAPD
jgi:glucan 1,3-beta-glucosidase